MTFQKCRGGISARTTPRAEGRVTAFRQRRRAVFSAAVLRWQALSGEQRAAWDSAVPNARGYGLRGPLKPCSGYGYFVSQYSIDLFCGGVVYDTVPPGGVVRQLSNVTVAIACTPFSVVLGFSPVSLTGSEGLMLGFTVFASTVSSASGQPWFAVGGFGGGLSSPVDVASYVGDLESVFQLGRAVGVRLSIYDADLRRLCRPVEARTVVSA